jgi:hypothetical protein
MNTISGLIIWVILFITVFIILFSAPKYQWGRYNWHMNMLYFVILTFAFIVVIGPYWGIFIGIIFFILMLIPYCDSFL